MPPEDRPGRPPFGTLPVPLGGTSGGVGPLEPVWILVADGDAGDRMLLFRLLERAGHHATVVDDGRGALALLRAEPFDLVFVDLLLPGLDCYELIGTVKGDRALCHIPLILTTEGRDLQRVAGCLEMGAEDYLPKPIDPVLLRARITAGLATKRLRNLEAEWGEELRHLAEAATFIGSETFVSAHLERLSRRTNPCGRLALSLLQMAVRVEGREQRLHEEVASLRRQINGAGHRGG